MWLTWVYLLFALPALYTASSTISFIQNYRAAKKTGLPVVSTPVYGKNLAWLVLEPLIGHFVLKLPFGLGLWVWYSRYMWVLDERSRTFQEKGKTFMVVSPGRLQIYSVDVDVLRQVFLRKKHFERSTRACKQMPQIVQPSVGTVSGSEWRRHRRITAAPFDENNMRTVWQESLAQASGLAQWWSSVRVSRPILLLSRYKREADCHLLLGLQHGDKGFRSSCSDIKTLALNVIAAAGLGYSWEFSPAGKKANADEFFTRYRDNVAILITSVRLILITPKWMYNLKPKWVAYLPKGFRDHVLVAQAFHKQMRQLVNKRKAELAAGKENRNIFLNAIIARSTDMLQEKQQRLGDAEALSEDEIFANMIGYNIAGHETTAHTLNYCFHILSVETKWQEWIRQEVDHVYNSTNSLDPANLDYDHHFHRLKRCLAFMYEMLRLFGPVADLEKHVLGGSQELRVDGRTILLPADTEVHMPNSSAHLLPEYWGADSQEFRPSRWITSSTNAFQPPGGTAETPNSGKVLDLEEVAPPPVAKESFFPWSLGARNCPGKKFSQVEFVAIVSYVLYFYRAEAIAFKGETTADTRRRIWDWTRESKAETTLNFCDPEKYAMKLVRR